MAVSFDELLDVVVACAREAGREGVLLAQSELRHHNAPRGRKAEPGRQLRDQRKAYEAALVRLQRAKDSLKAVRS